MDVGCLVLKSYSNHSKAVTVLDLGFGNIFSLCKALKYAHIDFEVVNSLKDVDISRLILPGVGAFNRASSQLHNDQYTLDALYHLSSNNQPILGICLGMQLLFSTSEENGLSKGLNLFNSDCISFSSNPAFHGRLPHVGFNYVTFETESCQTWKNIPTNAPMYFVHSFRVPQIFEPLSDDTVIGLTNYEQDTFVSHISRGNIVGAQFHPEKSHRYGLLLLSNFSSL